MSSRFGEEPLKVVGRIGLGRLPLHSLDLLRQLCHAGWIGGNLGCLQTGCEYQPGVVELGVQRVDCGHHLGKPLLVHVRRRLAWIQAHINKATVTDFRHGPLSHAGATVSGVAQLVHRVTGRDGSVTPKGRPARVVKRFPDTRQGRQAADAFAKSLGGAKRFYDVRISVNGETRMQSFTRRKDADAWIAQTGPDRLRGVVSDPRRGQIPFAEVVERWFEARTTKRPRSVDRDREIMRVHVLPVIGGAVIAAVSRADIQRLADGWAAAKLSPGTVARQYSAVRAVFNWAMAADIVDKSPCRGIKLPQDRRKPKRQRVSPEDLERLAAVLQRIGEERAKHAAAVPPWFGPSQAVMMWVGAATGLRWAEVAGRQVRDLNLLAAEITVTRQLDRNRKLVEPKSAAGERTFAIPQWLAEELAEHLARRALTAKDGDALVFAGAKGGPLNYSAWRRTLWAPACEHAGLAGLGFHDLRRINATALVAAKADPKVAQTRLGHTDVRLTLGLYAEVTPEADRLAADAVGAWLRPVVRGDRDRSAIKPVSRSRRSHGSSQK